MLEGQGYACRNAETLGRNDKKQTYFFVIYREILFKTITQIEDPITEET